MQLFWKFDISIKVLLKLVVFKIMDLLVIKFYLLSAFPYLLIIYSYTYLSINKSFAYRIIVISC